MDRGESWIAGGKVALGASLLLGISSLSGCADLMAKSAVAPAWFQAKAVEVKGEGYPDIHKVPEVRGDMHDQPVWDAEGAKLKSLAQSVDAEVHAPTPTPSELRRRRCALRRNRARSPYQTARRPIQLLARSLKRALFPGEFRPV